MVARIRAWVTGWVVVSVSERKHAQFWSNRVLRWEKTCFRLVEGKCLWAPATEMFSRYWWQTLWVLVNICLCSPSRLLDIVNTPFWVGRAMWLVLTDELWMKVMCAIWDILHVHSKVLHWAPTVCRLLCMHQWVRQTSACFYGSDILVCVGRWINKPCFYHMLFLKLGCTIQLIVRHA